MQGAAVSRPGPLLVALGLAALLGLRFGPVLAAASTDFVDFPALHGHALVFELPDTRLNSWILAWLDHTALRAPGELYQGNIHHPARDVLTGSEHLFGVALQLLPFEPFVDSAIARHQLALVVSSALLMATSFLAIRWATGSLWAAAFAAAFALAMPWRVTEISHLQLVSAQWLPLIWLGTVRGLLGDTRTRWLVALGIAVALQLLSSFYLAYFMTLSCAVVIAAVVALQRPQRRDVLRLAAAIAPGYALFVASALPYLARQAEQQLSGLYDPSLSVPPATVLAMLAPQWPWGFELLNEPANYWTPWAVLVLAGVGVAALRSSASTTRRRALTAALAAIVGLALVMMLGGSLQLGSVSLPTPARLFSELLPGFSLLRGPTRWGILAGVALPLLAGLGVHALDLASKRALLARIVLAASAAATFGWFAIPTQPAWLNPPIVEARYEALRELPAGAVLELPWDVSAGDIDQGSRSVLASTLHWRPTVNGYTGHRPHSYRFVQRIASHLPAPRAIEQLRRLTGLRFVLLDLQRIHGPELKRWTSAEAAGLVQSVFATLHTRIYEIPAARPTGDLIAPLIDPAARTRTFNGLPRDPLSLPMVSGTLRLDTERTHSRSKPNPARLRIRNTGAATWPGFDVDPDGLVALRYSYFPRKQDEADVRAGDETRLAGLDIDVAPGPTVAATALLQAPRASGGYELCADLVQRVGNQIRPLPVAAVRRPVFVRGVSDEGELAQSIDSALKRSAPLPACGNGS